MADNSRFPHLYMNPDHTAWAREFCRIACENGFNPSDPEAEAWVATWIANAMMHGDDRARDNFPTVLPDGSAFVVDDVTGV